MIRDTHKADRGSPPGGPVQYLRRLLGRDPDEHAQARVIHVQETFGLKSGDSIFIIIAILETYLSQVEHACTEVRRTTRRIIAVACGLSVLSSAVMIGPAYLMIVSQDGVRIPHSPFRSFVLATIENMSEADVQRIASSSTGLSILRALPTMTEQDKSAVNNFLIQQSKVKTP